MFGSKKNKQKKTLLSIILSIFVFIEVFGFLFVPRPAKAQAVTILSDLEAQVGRVLDDLAESLYSSALGALVQGASYFMRKLAYDSASYIASGGKGQGALVFKEGFGSYIEHVASDSLAETIDQFGKGIGVDLCKPPNIDFQIALKLGLSRLYMPDEIGQPGGPQPNCSWQELTSNWEEGADQDFGLGSAANFADSLRVDQTDFGIALGSMVRVDRLRLQSEKTAEVERIVGKGFKPVTDLISGKVKTPAAVIEEETTALTGKNQGKLTADQISGIYGAGAAQILPTAASVFMNTLVSKLLDQLLNPSKGLVPSGDATVTDYYASSITRNRQAAERAFNFLFTAVPRKQQNAYDIVAEFSSCPDTPGLNNCIIEDDFRQLLERARVGNPMTIREALDEGLLHANWLLVSPRREADNTDIQNCYINKYCYSNLQKLRKVRILPLGFEIAALRSDPDESWTLGQVVDGFDDCTYSGNTAIPDPSKPFCHLIDPNWIIRAPEARCEALVYGPQLIVSDAPTRRQECVDISTCITEGENGECIDNYYSYCTKEKKIWRFGSRVNICDEQFATCRLFTNNETNEIAAYLTRTLDYGECNASNKGCLAYSAEKIDDDWLSSIDQSITVADKQFGRNSTYYFNDNLDTQSLGCTESQEGCSAFYPIVNGDKITDPVYFKKTPDYLGCYDTDLTTTAIDWPVSLSDLALLPDKLECKNDAFSFACVEDELGCQAYSPKDGGPDVPGIIGANACDAQCVGYDTYKEEKSNFDEAHYPLYFRPQDAQTAMAEEGLICSDTYNGCEEFTNLEEGEAGEQKEYFSYTKYCEDPEQSLGEVTNQKTFYSWEGSMNQGYVLKIHHLRPIDDIDSQYLGLLNLEMNLGDTVSSFFPVGSPAYADDRPEEIQLAYNDCNEQTYKTSLDPAGVHIEDPDCRALYDSDQNVYYRNLSKIITVDENCQPWRKTVTRLYNVPELNNNQTLCEAKGGNYELDGACNRCYNGGEYQPGQGNAGLCIYHAIPSESTSCPAEANGCRIYTGNAGDNVEYIFASLFDTFEPEGDDADALINARGEWQDSTGNENVRVVAESIKTLEYSLLIDAGRAEREIVEEGVENQEWYELEFWARGVPQGLDIWLEQSGSLARFTENELTGETNLVSIGDEWNKYTLGPIQFLGQGAESDDPVLLVFDRMGNGQYFIDNVALKRVEEHFYLIEDSWKQVVEEGGTYFLADVAEACDSAPLDGLPGEALGCREYIYTDLDGSQASEYAVGFEKLCREEAVGCAPFVDTHNTLEEFGDDEGYNAFNVECRLGVEPVAEQTICTIAEEEDWRCTVLVGETSCFVEHVYTDTWQELLDLESQNGFLVDTTIVVPADNLEEDPIYLTRTIGNSCNAENLGCQRFGQESQILPDAAESSFVHSDTFIKNDPRFYIGENSILCREDLVGCGEFRSGNTISYFKDPNLLGNKFCQYREENDIKGWFKIGVGQCEDTLGNTTGSLCTTESDCNEGESCNEIGNIPCYEDYLIGTAKYGIWSNGSINYDDFVGLCPQEQHLCTEIVDPADSTETHPQGQPYYVIFNDQVTGRIGECEGKVSLRDGCVLFDKTDNANKLYSAAITYELSDEMIRQNKSPFVAPQPAGEANDSNIILKVDRDRICSEWLSCKTKFLIEGPDGRDFNLCHDYRACKEGDETGCDTWVGTGNTASILDYNAYITRDTSWHGEEYTGYSLFNKYQVNDFSYIFVKPEEAELKNAKPYVAYQIADENFGSDAAILGCQTKEEWDRCGVNLSGRCVSGMCTYPIDGSYNSEAESADVFALESMGTALCKAHPEADSPFETSVAINAEAKERQDMLDRGTISPNVQRVVEFTEKQSGFQGANICQNGACSCSYQKLEFKNGQSTYWGFTNQISTPPKHGICDGGEKDGMPCVSDTECREGQAASIATCSLIAKKETHLGLEGYCLEYDRSRPVNSSENKYTCLTWLPIESSASLIDNYNNDPATGYYPPLDALNSDLVAGSVYCTDATGRSRGFYKKSMWSITSKPASISFKELFAYYFLNRLASGLGWVTSNFPEEVEYVSTDTAGNIAKHHYTATQLWAWYFLNEPNAMVWTMNKGYTDGGVVYGAGETYVLGKDEGTKVYEDDIKTIYFVGNEGFDPAENDPPLYSQFFSLDFNELHSLKPETGKNYVWTTQNVIIGTDFGYKFDSLGNLVADIRETVDYGARVYPFYGVVNKNQNFEDNPDRVRYGLVYTARDYSIDQIKAFIEEIIYNIQDGDAAKELGLDFVSFDFITDETIEGETKRYIPNGSLPFTWYGTHTDDALIDKVEHPNFMHTSILVPKVKCAEFAQIYNELPDDLARTTNKAWTDRVWQMGREKIKEWIDNTNTTDFFDVITRLTSFTPFGSLSLSQYDLESNTTLNSYFFQDSSVDGIPYSCDSFADLYAGSEVHTEGPVVYNTSKFCQNLTRDYPSFENIFSGNIDQDVTGENLLAEIFAKAFRVKARNEDSMNNFIDIEWKEEEGDSRMDKSLNLGTENEHIYPLISSLNPFTCFETEAGIGSCDAESDGAFSINGKDGVRKVNADYNRDGTNDYSGGIVPYFDYSPRIGVGGSYVATLQFFAEVDDNHMPIKRVMIDWGDDTAITNQNRYGMYKNHKPACEADDDGNISFGNSERGCTDEPFTFLHTYNCNEENANTTVEAIISDPDTDEDLREALLKIKTDKPNLSACIYKPRVQILDNWGWCNGVCAHSYSKQSDGSFAPIPGTEISGCADGINTFIDQCEIYNGSGIDAWTYFDGEIIVVP